MLQRAFWWILLGTLVSFFHQARAQGQGKDYPPFTIIEGYQRMLYVDHRFDQAEFYENSAEKRVRVEGHLIHIEYWTKPNDTSGASGLEILRTFETQAKSVNAQVIYEPENQEGDFCGSGSNPVFVARFERRNMPVWVSVTCFINGTGVQGQYKITIVEEHALH